MVTEEERQWMWAEYAPNPRMRLNLGIRRRLAPLLDNDRRKIEVANSILFTLIGSPIIYYGDEIGMGDDIWLDDRNGVRTPMQWDSTPSAGFSNADPELFYAPVIDTHPYDPTTVNVAEQQADPNSLFNTLKKMIAIHKANQAFGWGSFEWVDAGTTGVAAYLRVYQNERLLILNNVTDREHQLQLPFVLPTTAEVILNSDPETPDLMRLKPYQYCWIRFRNYPVE
jgi:maltose alpha-D-glucosyltransferase/alpha-amylase